MAVHTTRVDAMRRGTGSCAYCRRPLPIGRRIYCCDACAESAKRERKRAGQAYGVIRRYSGEVALAKQLLAGAIRDARGRTDLRTRVLDVQDYLESDACAIVALTLELSVDEQAMVLRDLLMG